MKVGINGIAGRIGKFAAYELVRLGEVIGAVNDLAKTDEIVASLSHRDGVHGTLDWKVEKVDGDTITINGNAVFVNHEKDPANIRWGDEVKVVAECAGPFTERAAAERHCNPLSRGLEAVIISAPGKDGDKDMPTYVMGVNHTNYAGERVISNASCTTKALAVPMRVLLDAGLNVYSVLMDTTHAATNTQKPLDFMSTYGCLDTIQSAKTGAAAATGLVIPELKGKMDGFAMRVPTRDGSFANVYLVAESAGFSGMNKEVATYVNGLFEQAASDPRYIGRLSIFRGKEISSPDIIGNTASAVVALSKTKVMVLPYVGTNGQAAMVSFVSGYDNERGPAKDLALLTQYVMRR